MMRVSRQRRIFVTGPSSGSGKSTISLALLGALIEQGADPATLAYIKPATQGVQATLTAKFCAAKGIDYTHIGPIVFYRGFTHEYLDGDTASSEELLGNVKTAAGAIAAGKSITIIDGVGYPAVGSVAGCSNAAVAKASGAVVLVVGKEGVGNAIDSFNLCASYYEHQGVPVIGAIFNRISAGKEAVRTRNYVPKYFASARPKQKVYAFLDECDAFQASHDYAAPGTTNSCHVTKGAPPADLQHVTPCDANELALCSQLVKTFLSSGIRMDALVLNALAAHKDPASFAV